jgi:hypothetical protein
VIYQYKINAYHGINKKINESQEGFWKEYGGELFSTRLVNYKNNERQGPYIVINRDEPLVENYVSERGFYKNNQLHDTIRYFDDIGHLYYLKVYDSGKLLYEKSIPNAETEINLKRELVDIINENGNIAITKSEIFDLQTRDKIGSFDLTYQSQKTFLSDNGEFLVSLCVQYGDLGQYPFLVMQNLKSGQELQFGDDPNPFFAFFSNNDSILNVISYKSYFQKSKIRDTIITELVYSEYQTKPFDLTLKKRTIINNREHPIYIKKISKNRIAEVHLNKVYYLNSETYKVIDSIILPLLNHLEKDEKFQFHNDLLSIRNNANEVTLVDLKTRKTIYIKNKNIANLPLFKSYLNNDAYLVSAKHFFRVDLNSGNLQKIKNPLNTNNLILTRKNNWLYTNYQNDYNSYNDGYNMSNYIPKKINNNSLKIGWYSINGKETIKEFSDTEYGMPYILNLDVSKNNLKIIDFNRSQDNIINLNLKSGISTTNSISGKESNDIYYKSIADTIIEKYYVGDYQQGVFYSMIMKDDKIIETNNYSNGQIQFTNPLYPDYRGEKVKYFTFSNGTELFLCRDHYFMSKGSNNGLLGFRMNLKYYSSEQFDLKYNRPDIILERLGYADSSTIASYHSAYLKRLKRMGFTEDMLKDDFHLPEIKIKNFEYLPTLTDSSDLNLDLDIKDSKYKLDRINIFINDVPVFGTAGIDLRKENIQEINKKINLSLSEGENKIQVSVLNQAGAESYKETVYITYKPKKPVQPDLYLVTIGDSKYSDSRYDLTYASKDATDIKTAFEKNSNSLYGAVYAFNYTDTQVTKENILKLKSELQKAKRDDVVIITVAGHGVLDKNLDYYLATHDMDFSNPSEKGLPYEAQFQHQYICSQEIS